MRQATGMKPKTRKRLPARKELRKMAKTKPERHSTPSPDADITYEPAEDDHLDSSSVVVDVILARTPRSDNAKTIASQIKGPEQIDAVKSRRAGSGGIFEINPYDLYLEEGWNVRNFETPSRKANIARLASSISAIGVKETLLAHIKDGKIYVHSGWNRLLATYHAIEQGAPIVSVPVRFGRASEDDADRTLSQLVNNGVRSDLTPWERGKAIKRMVNFGWQPSALAEAMGKSVTNVNHLLSLQGLPMPMQELVSSGVISSYYAQKVYRETGENEELTMQQLHSAIERARAKGSARVMPKHANPEDYEEPPPRRERKGGGGRRKRSTSTPDTKTETAPVYDVPLLIQILHRARAERDEEAGTVLVVFKDTDFDELAVLANFPEGFETTIDPNADAVDLDFEDDAIEVPNEEPAEI